MVNAVLNLSDLNGSNGFVINGIDAYDSQAAPSAVRGTSTATASTT